MSAQAGEPGGHASRWVVMRPPNTPQGPAVRRRSRTRRQSAGRRCATQGTWRRASRASPVVPVDDQSPQRRERSDGRRRVRRELPHRGRQVVSPRWSPVGVDARRGGALLGGHRQRGVPADRAATGRQAGRRRPPARLRPRGLRVVAVRRHRPVRRRRRRSRSRTASRSWRTPSRPATSASPTPCWPSRSCSRVPRSCRRPGRPRRAAARRDRDLLEHVLATSDPTRPGGVLRGRRRAGRHRRSRSPGSGCTSSRARRRPTRSGRSWSACCSGSSRSCSSTATGGSSSARWPTRTCRTRPCGRCSGSAGGRPRHRAAPRVRRRTACCS